MAHQHVFVWHVQSGMPEYREYALRNQAAQTAMML